MRCIGILFYFCVIVWQCMLHWCGIFYEFNNRIAPIPSLHRTLWTESHPFHHCIAPYVMNLISLISINVCCRSHCRSRKWDCLIVRLGWWPKVCCIGILFYFCVIVWHCMLHWCGIFYEFNKFNIYQCVLQVALQKQKVRLFNSKIRVMTLGVLYRHTVLFLCYCLTLYVALMWNIVWI